MMFEPKLYIGKNLQDVEPIFREHNQYTAVYFDKNCLKTFGTNEGGPSYVIYVDSTGVILDIQTITFGY